MRKILKDKNFFVFIIMILIVWQIVFTSYEINSQNVDYNREITSISLQRKAAKDEQTYVSVANFAATVYSDYTVLGFMQRENNGKDELSEIGYLLRKYSAILNNVNNVYLYSEKQQRLYDMYLHSYNSDSAKYQNITKEINAQFEKKRKMFTYTANATSGEQEYNICYFFTPDRVSKDAVIVEMDTSSVFDEYTDIRTEIKGSIIVVQNDGVVLYGDDEFAFGENISGKEFFGKRNKESKVHLINSNGRKNVYNYYYSKQLDCWYISRQNNYQNFGNIVFNNRFIYLYIGLLITIFVAFNLLSNFKKLYWEIEIKKSENEDLSSEENTKYSFRGKFIDYVNGERKGENLDYMRKILSSQFDLQQKCGLLIVRINDFEKFRKLNGYNTVKLYCYGMKNIIIELLASEGFTAYDLLGNNDCLEFLIGNYSEDKASEVIEKICRDIHKSIKNYVGVSVSCISSEPVEVSEIGVAFKKVDEIREYSFLYEDDIIISSDVVREENISMFNETLELCDRMNEAVLKNTKAEIPLLDEFFDKLCLLERTQIKEALWRLMFVLSDLQHSFKEKDRGGYSAEKSVFDEIIKMESIKNIKETARACFVNISLMRKERSGDRMMDIVDICNDIIDEEYGDPNLNIEVIADRVNLSSNYLGRNYKKITGKSIADKILDKRLIMAEKLVTETLMEIQEIIPKCGFTNSPSYFSAIFKKRYGDTPIAYRNRHSGGRK